MDILKLYFIFPNCCYGTFDNSTSLKPYPHRASSVKHQRQHQSHTMQVNGDAWEWVWDRFSSVRGASQYISMGSNLTLLMMLPLPLTLDARCGYTLTIIVHTVVYDRVLLKVHESILEPSCRNPHRIPEWDPHPVDNEKNVQVIHVNLLILLLYINLLEINVKLCKLDTAFLRIMMLNFFTLFALKKDIHPKGMKI